MSTPRLLRCLTMRLRDRRRRQSSKAQGRLAVRRVPTRYSSPQGSWQRCRYTAVVRSSKDAANVIPSACQVNLHSVIHCALALEASLACFAVLFIALLVELVKCCRASLVPSFWHSKGIIVDLPSSPVY